MDLDLTDEQNWLAEAVNGHLSTSPGDGAWDALVSFGALSIAAGADGLGAVELALIARALGERLTVTPFLDTAAALYALRGLGESAESTIALALLEPGLGWELERPVASLSSGDGTGNALLDGDKVSVEHAARAERLLVVATDRDRRRLAFADPGQAGVSLVPAASLDGALPVFDARFHGAQARVLAGDATDSLLAIGAVLAAAEAVGAASAVRALACEYAGERRQFGVPIASFQALRHLLANMYVRETSAWSTVLFAAAALEDELDDAARTARIAKAYAARATLDVAHGAMQVFGGIAFTDEHPAHRFLRRIIVRGRQFGDARHHERALGRALAAERLPEAVA